MEAGGSRVGGGSWGWLRGCLGVGGGCLYVEGGVWGELLLLCNNPDVSVKFAFTLSHHLLCNMSYRKKECVHLNTSSLLTKPDKWQVLFNPQHLLLLNPIYTHDGRGHAG